MENKMKRSVVKLDLSNFYGDERKYVLIMIDNEWKTVKMLQQHVESIFGFKDIRFISNDGYFLPPQEPIKIVHFVDKLKAFIPIDWKEEKNIKSKNKKHSMQELLVANNTSKEEQSSIAVETDVKKRKLDASENGSTSSTKPSKKRAREALDTNDTESVANEVELINRTSSTVKGLKSLPKSQETSVPETTNKSQHQLSFNKKERKQKKLLTNTTLASEPYSAKALNSNSVSEVTNKSQHQLSYKKKDRKPNEPLTNTTAIAEPYSSKVSLNKNTSTSLSMLTSTPVIMKKLNLPKGKKNKSHIRFTESDENGNSKEETNLENDNKKNVKFNCELSEKSLSNPRRIPTGFKQKIEIQEQIIFIPTLNSATNTIIKQSFVTNENQNHINSSTTEDLMESVETICPKKSEENNVLIENNNETNISFATEREKNVDLVEDSIALIETIDDDDMSVSQNYTTESKTESEKDEGNNDLKGVEVANGSRREISESIEEAETTDIEYQADNTTNNFSQEGESSYNRTEEDSNVIDLNETELDNTTEAENESIAIVDNDTVTIDKILPLSIDLKSLPVVDDVVLFKMFKFDSTNSAAVSQYIAGKCEYVNKRSKMIRMRVFDGVSEISQIPYKFSGGLDESEYDNEIINIKLDDMVEPKLFKM